MKKDVYKNFKFESSACNQFVKISYHKKYPMCDIGQPGLAINSTIEHLKAIDKVFHVLNPNLHKNSLTVKKRCGPVQNGQCEKKL